MLKEIQKLLPPVSNPEADARSRRVWSPTATIYKGIVEVELVPTSHAVAGPSQAAKTSKQQKPVRVPEWDKSRAPEWTRSPPIRRKSTEPLARLGRVQSLERAKTPERAKNPEQGHDCRDARYPECRFVTKTECMKKKELTPEHSGLIGSESEDGLWEQTWPSTAKETNEEVTPSPNMCKIFTWLQERRLLTLGGGASESSKPVGKPKTGKATKKHRTT